jgi:hypothetical protein
MEEFIFGRPLSICSSKLRKATISFVMSVCLSLCPSVRKEQLVSHCIYCHEIWYLRIFWKYVEKILLLLPLALQPAVGFGLSKNTSPFVPNYHQLSPFSHSQHLKISFHFFSPSFPGSSFSSRPVQFLSGDLFGHPILLHSLQMTQLSYPLPLYPFYYIFSFIQLF